MSGRSVASSVVDTDGSIISVVHDLASETSPDRQRCFSTVSLYSKQGPITRSLFSQTKVQRWTSMYQALFLFFQKRARPLLPQEDSFWCVSFQNPWQKLPPFLSQLLLPRPHCYRSCSSTTSRLVTQHNTHSTDVATVIYIYNIAYI